MGALRSETECRMPVGRGCGFALFIWTPERGNLKVGCKDPLKESLKSWQDDNVVKK